MKGREKIGRGKVKLEEMEKDQRKRKKDEAEGKAYHFGETTLIRVDLDRDNSGTRDDADEGVGKLMKADGEELEFERE